jgi:hypothetical protein
VNAYEAVGRDPALQEGPELFFNEPRRRAVAISLSREESFELAGDDAVKNGLFRPTREVFKRGALHAPMALCRPHTYCDQ